MKKTIAFFAGLALLVAALSGTGCKPRDAKKLALAMAPQPAVNACNVSNFIGSVGTDGFCNEIYGDTYDAENLFDDYDYGYASGGENVYAINIPYTMDVEIVVSAEGIPVLTVRRNCDPNDMDAIIDGTISEGWATVYVTLEPGTYYVVIDSLYGAFNYWWGICDGIPDDEV